MEKYWCKPWSDLNCMIQHYGPMIFLTLSSSEWLWDELGQYTREVNGWCDNSSSHTNVLVAKDSVLISKFLNNKFRTMMDFICSTVYFISGDENAKIEVYNIFIYYFRFLWKIVWKNTPIIDKSSVEKVSKFFLRHISKMPDKNISIII